MEDRQELRKMPKGETCPECGSQKWYLEDGLRFCSRGHQIEGFIQFDLGDEVADGELGFVVRRKKEVREIEKRQLTGQEGKTLYLEAIQLLLRMQANFLVRDMGHKDELETVIRDLWDLRIRGYGSIPNQTISEDTKLQLFSSQPTTSSAEGGPTNRDWRTVSRGQSWNPEQGSDWPLPRLSETVALCYLGCLLLKTATRLTDLLTWVSNGSLPYLKAYSHLPIEMQKRMPSQYANALKLPSVTGLRGQDLYQTVMSAVLSYKMNYEMTFPEINYFPMLVQYVKELALPVETIIATKRLAAVLNFSFEFPVSTSRIFPLDHPELRLVAFLVVSAKLCFPLDWEKWKTAYSEGLFSSRRRNEEMHRRKDEDVITQFFPTAPEPGALPSTLDIIEGQIEEQARRIFAEITTFDKTASPEAADYEAYRAAQDLSETARILYAAAGETAGLSVDMMVQAVYQLEQRMMWWQRQQPTFEA